MKIRTKSLLHSHFFMTDINLMSNLCCRSIPKESDYLMWQWSSKYAYLDSLRKLNYQVEISHYDRTIKKAEKVVEGLENQITNVHQKMKEMNIFNAPASDKETVT